MISFFSFIHDFLTYDYISVLCFVRGTGIRRAYTAPSCRHGIRQRIRSVVAFQGLKTAHSFSALTTPAMRMLTSSTLRPVMDSMAEATLSCTFLETSGME